MSEPTVLCTCGAVRKERHGVFVCDANCDVPCNIRGQGCRLCNHYSAFTNQRILSEHEAEREERRRNGL